MISQAIPPIWFTGVVEENNDPIGNGRVQVRVFGVHPPYDDSSVMTEDLPWAMVMNGTYGAIHRVPDIGEWVVGLALDGRDHLNLMVIGQMPGMQRSGPASSSFAPNSYIKPSQDMVSKIGNPPIPPQMTGEDLEYTPALIAGGVVLASNSKTPDGEGLREPAYPMGDKPNKTTVWNASYNGSNIEVNDDENSGFINITHASGSNIQIDSAGTILIKSMAESWDVSASSSKSYSGGRKDIIVDGGNYTLSVTNGDVLINSTGDFIVESSGNISLNAAKKIDLNAGEGVTLAGAKIGLHALADDIEMKCAGSLVSESGKASVEKTPEKFIEVTGSTNITNGDGFNVQSSTTSLKGSGDFNADFSMAYWQSGSASDSKKSGISIPEPELRQPPVTKTKTGIMMLGSTSNGSFMDVDEGEMM